jgi:hypothetical protein
MSLKAELKHAESELKKSIKILKGYGIKSVESYMDNNCGGTLESELGYAFYQRGKIMILERLAYEASPIGAKRL